MARPVRGIARILAVQVLVLLAGAAGTVTR